MVLSIAGASCHFSKISGGIESGLPHRSSHRNWVSLPISAGTSVSPIRLRSSALLPSFAACSIRSTTSTSLPLKPRPTAANYPNRCDQLYKVRAPLHTRSGLEQLLEVFHARRMAQFAKGLHLNLADPFTANPQFGANLGKAILCAIG